ncbi:MAG: SCO family protein [Candidatus Eremiobacteraeota bacterium]|nr:SCO family protein [Candidatus Eremiobacteraeota bacterium]
MKNSLLRTLLIGLILAAGCSRPQPGPSASPSPDEHAHHHHHQAMESGPPSQDSIYNLEATWQDQNGNQRRLIDDRGKVVVLAMIYSSCKGACPRIVADMQAIEKQVSAEHPEAVAFRLVSFDPEVDTPQRLQEYAQEAGLGPHWKLLCGPEEQVLELAALLGVKYRRTGPSDFAHSNLITVLNDQGEIVHQQEGLGVDPAATLAVIEQLLAGH